jgi:hypothetical protein
VYDGTVAAGALTIVNNHDSGNLSLTGGAFLAGKDAGPQPVITSTAAAARVRNANGNTGASAAATISVTMGGAPAPGNTMVAVIATRGTTGGGNIVSSITQTGVPNGTWVRAAEAHNTSMTTEIWYAPNLPAGAGTAVTINQTPFLSAAVVMEYAGILAAVPLDQIAPGNSGGTSQAAVTGTITATTQARELWIGGIGFAYNSTRTLGTILNSFTTVDNAVTSPGLCSRTYRQRDRNRLIRRHHQRQFDAVGRHHRHLQGEHLHPRSIRFRRRELHSVRRHRLGADYPQGTDRDRPRRE